MEVAVARHQKQPPLRGKGDRTMKKALFAFAAAAALTLGSAAYAQSSPSPVSGDKAPPTSDTGTVSPDGMNKPDSGKKATKSKPGSSTNDDTTAGSKTGTTKP
jgi:hypothetical protein